MQHIYIEDVPVCSNIKAFHFNSVGHIKCIRIGEKITHNNMIDEHAPHYI